MVKLLRYCQHGRGGRPIVTNIVTLLLISCSKSSAYTTTSTSTYLSGQQAPHLSAYSKSTLPPKPPLVQTSCCSPGPRHVHLENMPKETGDTTQTTIPASCALSPWTRFDKPC
jgi:hypothetical protein